MRCKIVRFQKLMWHNLMRSTKSQKISILHYNIDYSWLDFSLLDFGQFDSFRGPFFSFSFFDE